MNCPTRVTVLPIGEFDNEILRNEFEAMVSRLAGLEAEVFIANAVSSIEEASQFVSEISAKFPDILLMIPLRGLSAPIMEPAGLACKAPVLIWPVQGRYALPSSSLAVGALKEAGKIVELIYGPPDLPEVTDRIRCVLRTAKAFIHIQQSRVGVIGNLFPNLVSCRYDPQTVKARLGTDVHPVSYAEIEKTIQELAGKGGEIENARGDIIRAYSIDPEFINVLDPGIKLHLALKKIAGEHQLDGFAIECWTGLPQKLGLNPCLGFVDDAYSLACEGDVMLCISLIAIRHITDASAYVGDLYDLDMNGNITLIHCGAPASLAENKKEVTLEPSSRAHESGFETMTVRPQLKPGPVTLFRFYGQDCDRMHLAMGELTGCDLSANQLVKVRLAGNRWDFLRECLGNHYIVVAGDIRGELTLLGKWLGITIYNT